MVDNFTRIKNKREISQILHPKSHFSFPIFSYMLLLSSAILFSFSDYMFQFNLLAFRLLITMFLFSIEGVIIHLSFQCPFSFILVSFFTLKNGLVWGSVQMLPGTIVAFLSLVSPCPQSTVYNKNIHTKVPK